MNIVVLERDAQIRQEMLNCLSRPGWTAYGVSDAAALNLWLNHHKAEVVVLDVEDPTESGYRLCSDLRKQFGDLGLVMLSPNANPASRATLYMAGADVLLTKPAHPEELMFVVHNLGRRVLPKRLSDYVLNRSTCALEGPQGHQCGLTHVELRILETLARAGMNEVDIEHLLDQVQEQAARPISREALTVLVSRLRNKIRQRLGPENALLACRGVGYRLALPLSLN